MHSRIRENQDTFISSFEKSIFSKQLKKQKQSKEEYIEQILRLNSRNVYLSLIAYLKVFKFQLQHLWFPKVKKHNDELVVVCIIKNEEAYMREWIEFHRLVGVDRFYIFDNQSTDKSLDVLKPYIEQEIVECISIPGKAQLIAYNQALKFLKKRTKWAAFIDADEFLFPVEKDNLKEVLQEYEGYAGVGVNWIVYGPCGHVTQPQGLVIENYHQTFENRNHEMNCRIKSIVRPSEVLATMHPHTPIYKHSQLAVDENKDYITGEAMYAPCGNACTMHNSTRKLRINHYWTKSLEELQRKCAKPRADGMESLEVERTLQRLEGALMEDHEIDRFIPRLKEVLYGKE